MWALLFGLKTVAPAQLRSMIEGGKVAVFDVNSRERWQDGHVPGARNLDPSSFAAGDLPGNKDATVVFYCSNSLCRKAPNAARRARAMGYHNVKVMTAGIQGWRDKSLPLEAGGSDDGQ